MDYPSFSAWHRVLCSPKMIFNIAFYGLWDHYILGGALPYLASFLCGYLTTHFSLITEPHFEMLIVIGFVFLMMYLTLRLGFESRLWRQLFLMEKTSYCLLAVRDFISCCSIITNVKELVHVVYKHDRLRVYNLGEGTAYVALRRMADSYGLPIEESLIQSFLPTNGCDTTESCFLRVHIDSAIRSAELVIAGALLASSIARLLYMNSLYSYMTAVDLLSELDPFLQMQLRFDRRNGFERNTGAPFGTNHHVGTDNRDPPTSSIPSSCAPAPRWGWPLSVFREDIAGSFSG